MKTYKEALRLALDLVCPLPPKSMPLTDVLGLVVAGDVVATDSVPPFTNSAMDGFVVRAADCASASTSSPVKIRVVGEIQAGRSAVCNLSVGVSYRIMTGAVIPSGFDTVIPVEETRDVDDWIEVFKRPNQGDHVRLVGEDISVGELTIPRGRLLRPAEIGVLATIGCTEVLVHPRPIVAVITTGNELINASECPLLGQIRDANIYSMCAQVRTVGALTNPHPRVPDDLKAVTDVLISAVAESDLVLINGGISVGDFDYTKTALKNLGAEQAFWRVAQKPGRPMGMWLLDGKLIFGIPGNPVAAMIVFEEYVRPVLRRMMGYKYIYRPESVGIMDASWHKSNADGRMHFLRVAIRSHEQQLHVISIGPQGSGLLSSMMRANALALIPAETLIVPAGGEVLLHLTDEPEDH